MVGSKSEPERAATLSGLISTERRPVTTYLSVPRVTLEGTREDRAIELYAGLGRFIKRVGDYLFEVPSQDGRRTYEVHYGGFEESCSCPYHQYRGVACVHLLAVGPAHAARRQRSWRRHTFMCSGCSERFPLKDAIVV